MKQLFLRICLLSVVFSLFSLASNADERKVVVTPKEVGGDTSNTSHAHRSPAKPLPLPEVYFDGETLELCISQIATGAVVLYQLISEGGLIELEGCYVSSDEELFALSLAGLEPGHYKLLLVVDGRSYEGVIE